MKDCIVIIPTYNEKENIEKMIDTVMALNHYDLLIIDDNSPDGTAQLIKMKMEQYPDCVKMIEREGKQGLGTAYITGFRKAIKEGYSYIFEMDADFSHNPADLDRLYDCIKEGADIVVGSRYKTGVNVVNWPMGRVLMSYFASMYVRAITGMPIHDATAGFKCYKRQVLETIALDNIKFKGYAFQIEMKFTAWKLGFKIEEVPIIFTDRKEGNSKMSGGIFNEAFWGVIKLKVNSIFKKYKPAA